MRQHGPFLLRDIEFQKIQDSTQGRLLRLLVPYIYGLLLPLTTSSD